MSDNLNADRLIDLYIAGTWRGTDARVGIINPADETICGLLAVAGQADIADALASTAEAFPKWRSTSAFERSKIMRRAAELLRVGLEATAHLVTSEQGKPLPEARMELAAAADILDWYAEEGRRAYGRIIPARLPNVRQTVLIEPIGPVAAFTPWNFPASQAVRKIAAALAAGCTIIIKGPEEAPSAVVAIVAALADAGLPEGVCNLLFGVPSQISTQLIASPIIRKVSFTGSVGVGKHLAGLAAAHMKPCTMELGGHAPVIVFDDCDPAAVARQLVASKMRNAGQVCVSPTRFYVHERSYRPFADAFAAAVGAIKVGDGRDPATGMGPLANARRMGAVSELVDDALSRGATVAAGGKRIGNSGFFHAPTVLENLPPDARILLEEPFGPVASLIPFSSTHNVIEAANSTGFGLAAYVFTGSAARGDSLADALEVGMVSINHFGLALPETPFGGIKDSGYGREGGTEGLDAYTITKFVSHLHRYEE